MAGESNIKSIAFPTLGCGRLQFSEQTVINAFHRAVKDADCRHLKVCNYHVRVILQYCIVS